jgi:hypothetical protein
MSKDYPLYPKLTDKAKEEAEKLMEAFKIKMKSLADEIIGELYTNVSMYIDTDHWVNFRRELLDGFLDYNNSKIQGEYDFKKLRQKIYKDFKPEIDKDLNQDLLEKVKTLEKDNERLRTKLNEAQTRY